MPKIDRHLAGSFCWFELGTTDQAGAEVYYGSRFGWKAAGFRVGPNEFYTIFKPNGSDAAAAYTSRDGEPPHWNL